MAETAADVVAVTVQADVLHETVVACLDDLDDQEGEIIAVGIVVACRDGAGEELYRAYSDRDTFFEQQGIFRAALEVLSFDRGDDEGDDE